MITLRQFMLFGFAIIALVAIFFFTFRVAALVRHKSEVGGVVPFLSLGGVLAFLSGLGMVVYDRSRFEMLGLAIASLGALAIGGSILISRVRSKRT
jgi:hypothetical protein